MSALADRPVCRRCRSQPLVESRRGPVTELYCPSCEESRTREFVGTIRDPDLRGRLELVLADHRPFAVVPVDPRLQ